jgi:hypothetical protein
VSDCGKGRTLNGGCNLSNSRSRCERGEHHQKSCMHFATLSEWLFSYGGRSVTPAGALSGPTVAACVPRGTPPPDAATVGPSAIKRLTTPHYVLGILAAESFIEEVQRRRRAADPSVPRSFAENSDSCTPRSHAASARTTQPAKVIPFRRRLPPG